MKRVFASFGTTALTGVTVTTGATGILGFDRLGSEIAVVYGEAEFLTPHRSGRPRHSDCADLAV
ncbi:hypothetical protein [Rhodopirellula sp. SWK7]|uniref:hypothetical protein n=1 Tax=Rhodopirellula sp. SWK7 TaxID=595460 RepID=UPI0002BF316C|nr:hypothetical protein [Rhodopirellula sp. SWK7]EMI43695.1 secreted protein [Rhodopirellula sp. SWK7]